MIMRMIGKITLALSALPMALCLAACGNAGRESGKQAQSEPKAEHDSVFDLEQGIVHLNSGYDMPVAGLGTYALSHDECMTSVAALFDNGGRLIDTASFYGTEKSVGEAIRSSDVPREEIFVTTKLYPTQFSNAEEAIDEALETLDIEYIDLMLLHHPGRNDVEAYKALE